MNVPCNLDQYLPWLNVPCIIQDVYEFKSGRKMLLKVKGLVSLALLAIDDEQDGTASLSGSEKFGLFKAARKVVMSLLYLVDDSTCVWWFQFYDDQYEATLKSKVFSNHH